MRPLRILLCCAVSCAFFGSRPAEATIIELFGPEPYLSTDDRPDGLFSNDAAIILEDFEDNDATDKGLTFSGGTILLPNSQSGESAPVTDSVDADDGNIDGNGNGGHSYFYGGQSLTVTFPNPVVAAGLVWTDGDILLTNVLFEAFDADSELLASIDAGDLSDDFYTGQTAEDRFLGILAAEGISSLKISNLGGGSGIEIDHIQYQQTQGVPEPSGLCLLLLGCLVTLAGRRRR